jgi:hypothetical protein
LTSSVVIVTIVNTNHVIINGSVSPYCGGRFETMKKAIGMRRTALDTTTHVTLESI